MLSILGTTNIILGPLYSKNTKVPKGRRRHMCGTYQMRIHGIGLFFLPLFFVLLWVGRACHAVSGPTTCNRVLFSKLFVATLARHAFSMHWKTLQCFKVVAHGIQRGGQQEMPIGSCGDGTFPIVVNGERRSRFFADLW